ncbi:MULTISPECIES: hypothetical protein [unclassified Pseudomonas]|uniref:hypothetical protein n=1 Tax=unclassified Pseudomonas TaxID=196821 RepID=UPI001B31F6AF|nr:MULTISPECIES: hypothetical protein [unclassified Pseudomonas]
MTITAPKEGELWKIAVSTMGMEPLQLWVAQTLKEFVNTRAVSILGRLHSQWVGLEALSAIRKGQELAGMTPWYLPEDPTIVHILNAQRAFLLRRIVQALPPEVLPQEHLEWRLQLDIAL